MTITAVTFAFQGYAELWKVACELEKIEALNFGSSGFRSDFIADELTRRSGVAVLLLDDGKVVGYTAAMSAKEAYTLDPHYYGRDFDQAAYISNSSIHPDYQHKRYIWLMMDMLEEGLRQKGYLFLDRDTKSDLGYADKVISHYGKRVVFANQPELTMWGFQRYIRISL